MDYKFWAPFIVSVGCLVAAVWSGLMQRQALAMMARRQGRQQQPILIRYWPIAALWGSLLVLAWVPYVWLPIYVTRNPVLGLSGVTQNGVEHYCEVFVNGMLVYSSSRTSKVIAICGVRSPRVDRMTDTRVTISQPFTIENQRFRIQFQFSEPMIQAIRTGLPPDVASGGPFEVPATVWYEVALVPNNTDMSKVQSLADIERVGGTLMLDDGQVAGVNIRFLK